MVEDGFYRAPGWTDARLGAIGLWVAATDYCHSQNTDGVLCDIPENRELLPRIVMKRLGVVDEDDIAHHLPFLLERGIFVEVDGALVVSDYLLHNPSAEAVERTARKRVDKARHATHVQWHVNRGQPNPDCEFCVEEQQQDGGEGRPVTELPTSAKRKQPRPFDGHSEVVPQLIDRLAVAIQEQLGRRPRTVGWDKAVLQMLNGGTVPPADIAAAIDFATASPFWRSRVASMDDVSRNLDKLLMQARAETASPGFDGRAAPVA